MIWWVQRPSTHRHRSRRNLARASGLSVCEHGAQSRLSPAEGLTLMAYMYYKAILGKQWCGAMLLWGNKVRLVDTVNR